MTVTVAPFSDGESPMQSYNSVLCHRALQLHADAVLMYSNDGVVASARPPNHRKSADHYSRVSIEKCNELIAISTVGAIAPVVDVAGHNDGSRHARLWEVISAVAPSPSWKLLQAVSSEPLLAGEAAAANAMVTTATKTIGKLPVYDISQVLIAAVSTLLPSLPSQADFCVSPILCVVHARNEHPSRDSRTLLTAC